MPARRPSTATSRASGCVDARRGAARAAVTARRDQRLDLDQQRPGALEGGAGDAARGVLVGSGQEGPARVGDLGQTALGHLEDADLLRGAEAVLRRPEQAQRRRSLALQVQHGVDEVLQGLWSGQRPVLGHVADEDDRDAVALGHLHQPQRALADLADAARPAPRARRRSRSGSSRRSGRPAGASRARSRSGRLRSPPRPGSGPPAAPSSSPSRPARSRTWPADSSPVA